jgi:uncharacterized membrane protein
MRSSVACVFYILMTFSIAASAADVNSVAAGDVYYIWKIDGPNQRVVVRQVDYGSGRVKVAYQDGEIRWVSSADLKTKDEATGNDVALGAGLVAGALLYCALTDECRSNPTSPSTSSNAAAAGGFKVTNDCRHPIKVAIHYKNRGGNWISDGWWPVAGFASTYLGDSSNSRLQTTEAAWYYYAETTDGSALAWKGSYPKTLGNFTLPMVQLQDKEGDSEWTLTCPNM